MLKYDIVNSHMVLNHSYHICPYVYISSKLFFSMYISLVTCHSTLHLNMHLMIRLQVSFFMLCQTFYHTQSSLYNIQRLFLRYNSSQVESIRLDFKFQFCFCLYLPKYLFYFHFTFFYFIEFENVPKEISHNDVVIESVAIYY